MSSLEAADAHLKRWARTAPKKGGGYDKVDFEVAWEDGQTYNGRYDMVHDDYRKATLIGPHIQEELTFHAGIRRPSHLTKEQYDTYLQRQEREGGPTQDDYLEFLKRYEL